MKTSRRAYRFAFAVLLCSLTGAACSGRVSVPGGGGGDEDATGNLGDPCRIATDCNSASCVASRCRELHCANGVRDADESGVDCGGAACGACPGSACAEASTCQSGTCSSNQTCGAPTCSDGLHNGNETGVDCGGTCAAASNGSKTCGNGNPCVVDGDCNSGVCNSTCEPAASHCASTTQDADETGVDCGGAECPRCPDGQPCSGADDCNSGVCGGSNTCQSPGCGDGVKNGDETAVDCGGACALPANGGKTCDVGSPCGVADDCTSGACDVTCQPPTPHCANGVADADEAGVDCGGVCALPVNGSHTCADGTPCQGSGDCTSGVCNVTCQPPVAHCANTTVDADETGTDCGGLECPACGNGQPCLATTDCTSGICGFGNVCPGPTTCACQTPGCGDGVKNGNETDIDCGGGTCATCGDGEACALPGDCDSGFCNGSGQCAALTCGDGMVSAGEVCDTNGTAGFGDDNLNGQTCVLQGFASGTLGCAPGCASFATSQCIAAGCGNGQPDAGEACDDGNSEDRDNCRNNCTRPTCGDTFASTLATGIFVEECDDGDADDLDDCRNSCRLPRCGDSVVSTQATGPRHEVCDDGINDGSYGTCMPDCTLAPYCGDGQLAALNEECDDGINDGSYGTCRSTCRFAPYCGDGRVTSPPEVCDDHNGNPSDGCSATCTAIETGWFCPVAGASCLPACGNGRFETGEACDDGGRCTNNVVCTIGGAACADGSTCTPRSSDGCSATCTVEPQYACPRFGQACAPNCGNGVLDSGEVCDDRGLCDDNVTRCRTTSAATDCAGSPLHTCTTRSSDGCNSACSAVEGGYECLSVGQPCVAICGNGRLDGAEQCDFGGLNNDTQYGGCKLDCTLGARCGDSVVQGASGEECDSGVAGNTGAYGGCRQDCTWSVHCGDGAITQGESCENGGFCNNGTTSCATDPVCQAVPPPDPTWKCSGQGGDGCGADCKPESGYTCRLPGQPCTLSSLCKNGVIDGNERCDDGGLCNDSKTPCTTDAFCQLQNAAWTCTPRSGDGCDSTCSTVETGYFCPVAGQRCTATSCGDGIRAGFEQCDDHGNTNGDGCSATCRQEPSAVTCGNGILEGTEQCDDHNTTSTDGCSATCTLETNFKCFNTPNVLCGPASGMGNCACLAQAAVCGDKIREGVEECDDGKSCGDVAHTSCTANAQCQGLLNTCASRCGNFVCELGECSSCPGDCAAQCNTTALPNCGNGACGGGENATNCPSDCGTKHCGDKNFTACSADATCTAIAQANYPCVARAGDGCGPTCKVEALFECFPDGEGNFCRPICGDGKTLVAVGERCDDGNLTSGDGCSSACTVESGSTCTDMSGLPASIDLAFTYRDFRTLGDTDSSSNGECTATAGTDGYPTDTNTDPFKGELTANTSNNFATNPWTPRYCGHFDFDHVNSCGAATVALPGLVQTTLSAGGKPQFASRTATSGACTSSSATPYTSNLYQLSDATRFNQWYTTTANVNKEVAHTLGLVLTAPQTRTYVYNSACNTFTTAATCGLANGCAWNSGSSTCGSVSGGFFPLNHCSDGFMCDNNSDCTSRGGGNCLVDGYGNSPGYTSCTSTNTCRNFGFTSEFRTYFQYSGGETLTFSGDDDVWVFINGVLAVDLGGRHAVVSSSVTLSNTVDPTLNIKTDSRFNIYEKGIYEIAFFHAERHVSGSNFWLTLAGFLRADQSTCTGICGNGIAQQGEVCDDGNTNDSDSCHNNCTANGTPPTASCGNRFLDPGEACDDGNTVNTDTCTNACQVATCGDGFTQPALGEVCDDGAQNGTYGNCVIGCVALGPRCGDAILNGSETCDDGINNGAYGTCTSACTTGAACGDGVVQATYEECDAGSASNNGLPPARCNSNCTLNATCGDGITDAVRGEQCDNAGANNNATCDGCTLGCHFGPRCGDGIVNCGEVCDDGVNAGAYGGCNPGCASRASRCGDGVPDASEGCDLGVALNNGSYGGCNPDCSLAARCGDGFFDGGFEQCDLGTLANTGAYGTCNPNCTLPAYCGDTFVNGGESCDDGVNSGAYDTCNPDCSFPARCGDAIPQIPPEQCDNGTNNTTYGPGCRTNCTTPPSCGDGVIQSQFESCDSGLLGGRTCSDLNGNGVSFEPGDFDGGTLACSNATCAIDTSGCYRCGDHVKNGSEQCDGVGVCGSGAPSVDCGGLTCEALGFPSTTGLACTASCALDTSGCNATTCGNGVIDIGEQCDPTAPSPTGTRTCNDLDGDGTTGEPGDFAGGTLNCTASCTLDTTGCDRCGDGIKNGNELCDGSDVGTATCSSVSGGTFEGGTLTCNATCDGYDTSGCWACTTCSDCGGQACVNHQCGSCLTSSDCCAPLLCLAGVCTLF